MAVEAGDIHDCKSLIDSLAADLRFGSGRNDAMLFAEASRCARRDDRARLCEVAEFAAAQRGTAELALAIREDASMNLAAVAEMSTRLPRAVFHESGGDNLAATFSPELADLTI